MNAPVTFVNPHREVAVSVRDLINVNLALSDVLAEETRLMEIMQIGKVGELQERKLRLTSLMERYMRYLAQRPELLNAMTSQEKQDLRTADETFRAVARKNYDKLLVAREVNGAVVKCVTTELSRHNNNPVYNAAGNVGHTYRAPISVTLNQTI